MKLLKIDEEFKNLLPPLADDERSELENDIKKHGVLSSIITWNGFIIDGHNRYEICQRNGIEIPATKELEFDNRSDVLSWIISHQTGRRNLTKSQLVKAYSHVEEQLRKEAKERQSAGGGDKKSAKAKSVPSNLTKAVEKMPETAETVAKKIGVSKNTYKAMKQIVNEGTAEQIERMDKGGKGNGVSAIAEEIKEKKLNQDVPDGYKRCSKCGKVKPVDQFDKRKDVKSGRRSWCKECRRVEEQKSVGRDAFGARTPLDKEFASLSEEDIVGDLYEPKTVSFDDVLDDFKETSNGWVASIMRIIDSNKKEFQEKENREKMCGALACLETEILKMKERVNAYE